MSSVLRAPRVRLSWAAGSLSIYFYSYRVYRRPSRMPVQPWGWEHVIAEYTVPNGYTATQVAAQHIRFDDYMAGWAITDGEYTSGFDYVVTEVDIAGNEAQIAAASVTARNVTLADPGNPWITCNSFPPLNCPVEIIQGEQNEVDPGVSPRRYAGRPHWVTVTGRDDPGAVLTAGAQFFSPNGRHQINPIRAVSKSGLEVALLKRLGERVIGTVHVTGFGPIKTAREGVSFTMYETDDSTIADYNLPAGLVLNGTSQYLTTPSAAHLNPGSSAFSVVVAGRFADAAGAYALSKGNMGTADGYAVRRDASNSMQFFIDGATTSGGPANVSSSWFDDVRVAIGTTDGTSQVLYRDGVSVGTSSVTHGAVSNSVALVLGANNGGASGFMALNPGQSVALYNRKLTDAEALAASYYLLGRPGYRMPAGATIFVDLRDNRAWKGSGSVIKDLSDYANTVTAVASPVTRGIPWNFEFYESL